MNRRLFHNSNFVALWIGQAISSIGDYFSLLAIPIFVNRLTGSVMLVGLSFICTALPALVLGPVAGVFVDRLDRRKVMIASDVLRGLLMLCLLTVRDAGQVWVLYLVGFLVSCISQFFGPARGAVLPLVVPDQDDWLAANSAMRVLQTVGMLAGPALAGVTIGQFGERVAFLADGSSFLLSALAISFMELPRKPAGAASGAAGAANGAASAASSAAGAASGAADAASSAAGAEAAGVEAVEAARSAAGAEAAGAEAAGAEAAGAEAAGAEAAGVVSMLEVVPGVVPEAAPQEVAAPTPMAAQPAAAPATLGAALEAAEAVWAELREGLVFLLRTRTALGVGVCLTLSSIGFSTVNMIWIPYLQRAFGVGATGLGIADAALGVGMLISGLLVGWLARRASRTALAAGGMAFEGLMYMTIILLPSFPWIIAWQFVGGLALTPMQSALDTILQVAVPDLKRGRVSSAINASYNAAGLLGMGLASVFGERIGLQVVFLIVGVFALTAGIIGFWLLREPKDQPLYEMP